MNNKALIVNLYGGPGSGKSSMCAGLFSWLKWKGVNCEMAMEYAKTKVWEKSLHTLDNQIYVFGKQHHIIFRLKDQVDVILTDSPLLLSVIYDSQNNYYLRQLVFCEYNKFRNFNIFLNRKKQYNPSGRLQTIEEAKNIDYKIKSLLDDNKIDYISVDGTASNLEVIGQQIIQNLYDNAN